MSTDLAEAAEAHLSNVGLFIAPGHREFVQGFMHGIITLSFTNTRELCQVFIQPYESRISRSAEIKVCSAQS